MAVNPTAAADGIVDPTDHEIHTFSTTNSIQMIDPRRLQDYTMSERSIVSQPNVHIALYITL